jgi:ankyrin repeat protein
MGKATGYSIKIIVIFSIFFLFLSNGMAAGARESTMKYFQGSDSEKMLEQALEQDSAEGIVKAIKAGANPNSRGLYGVTPLEMAVGKFKKQVVAELLRQGADTSVRDVEGDNAVTIAVRAYKSDPQLLDMLLDAGADPNTLRVNGDPIIVRFLADHDLDAIRYLHEKGANIDTRKLGKHPIFMLMFPTAKLPI